MEYIGEKFVRQEIHVTESKVVVYEVYQKTYKVAIHLCLVVRLQKFINTPHT